MRLSKQVLGLAALTVLAVIPVAALAERTVFQGAAGGNKPVGRTAPKTFKKINLKGSRGETLNFLVKIQGSACGELAAGPFVDAAGGPAAFPVHFSRMDTIRTILPSFPGAFLGNNYDPLVPVAGSVCGNGKSKSWYWGELEIPAAALPGGYRGEISFAGKKISVNLTVWRMQMPEVPAFPAYAELTPGYLDLAHYGEYRNVDPNLLADYITMMQAHRMYPIKTAVDYPPVIPGSGAGDVLDLLTHPDASRALYHTTISRRPSGLYFDLPAVPHLDWREPEVPDYYRAMQNTLGDLNRPGQAMLFLWDEPQDYNIPELIEYASLVKQWTPDAKIMVTVPGLLELSDVVDIYVPAPDYWGLYAPEENYRILQQTGHEVWWYISCMSHGCAQAYDGGTPDLSIERPAVYVRALAWTAAKYDISAFFYYSVNNGYRLAPNRDPWQDLMDFTGNGDGTLFYPGRPGERGLAQHQPIASARLKLWREAAFDAEYIRWMKTETVKPAWWDRDFAKLVRGPKAWNKKYTAYSRLRDKIGSYFDSRN